MALLCQGDHFITCSNVIRAQNSFNYHGPTTMDHAERLGRGAMLWVIRCASSAERIPQSLSLLGAQIHRSQ